MYIWNLTSYRRKEIKKYKKENFKFRVKVDYTELGKYFITRLILIFEYSVHLNAIYLERFTLLLGVKYFRDC